jgi:hypothetical protein
MNFYTFYGSKITKTTLLFINLTGIIRFTSITTDRATNQLITN